MTKRDYQGVPGHAPRIRPEDEDGRRLQEDAQPVLSSICTRGPGMGRFSTCRAGRIRCGLVGRDQLPTRGVVAGAPRGVEQHVRGDVDLVHAVRRRARGVLLRWYVGVREPCEPPPRPAYLAG